MVVICPNDLLPLRHVRQSAGDPFVRRQRGDVLAVEQHAPGAQRQQSTAARSSVVLPAPLWPMITVTPPAGTPAVRP